MNEVRATISQDSSGAERSFDRLKKAHEGFITNEDRAAKAVETFTEQLFNSQSAGEAIANSLNRIDRALNLTGTALFAFSIGQGLVGAFSKSVEEADKEIQKFFETFQKGVGQTSMDLSQLGAGDLTSKIKEQEELLKSIEARRKQISDSPVKSGVFALFTGGEQGGMGERRRLAQLEAGAKAQTKLLEEAIAQKILDQNKSLELKLAKDERGLKLHEIQFSFVEKIRAAQDSGNSALVAALQQQQQLQEELASIEADKAAFVKRTSNEEGMAKQNILRLQLKGDNEAIQRAEVLAQSVSARNQAQLAGNAEGVRRANQEADIRLALLDKQLAKEREEIQFQTALASSRSSMYAREASHFEAKIARLNTQLKAETDLTKQMQLQSQIAQAQQVQFDKATRQRQSLTKGVLEGRGLDQAFVDREKTSDEQKNNQDKLKLAMLQQERGVAGGDPEALLSVANKLRAMRNELAQPIDRTNFSVTEGRSRGAGGRMGSGGDPMFANSQEQTRLLKGVEEELKSVNKSLSTTEILRLN